MSDRPSTTVGEAAILVLNKAAPDEKTALSFLSAQNWFAGKLSHEFPHVPPERPARPKKPELLLPKFMPRRRGIHNQNNMMALLHAVGHIEFNAIDLAWDIVARFGQNMPREFIDDWIKVADDETRHFKLIQNRLAEYNVTYGDLPAHDGLWQSAMDTAQNLKARLAVVPLVLEARGLDVTPAIITKFENSGDYETADILNVIYKEEIQHVQAGQKWFHYLCHNEDIDPRATFQSLIQQYFNGKLKPPFNIKARSLAGLNEDFYLPLAASKQEHK